MRTRLKYALVAAAASITLYAVAGSLLGAGNFETGEQLAIPIAEYARPEALSMLLAPALTIILCVRGRALIQAIWYGIFSAIALGLVTGALTLSDVYVIAPPRTLEGRSRPGSPACGM